MSIVLFRMTTYFNYLKKRDFKLENQIPRNIVQQMSFIPPLPSIELK